MANQKIKTGTKFKQKHVYEIIHEVISIDEEKNHVMIKSTNIKDDIEQEKKWRLDDINYFLGTGDYIIENTRPETTKHNQLEDCGSHSD